MSTRIALVAVAIAVVVVLRGVEARYFPGPRRSIRDGIVDHFVKPIARPFANTPALESAATAVVYVVPECALAFAVYFAVDPGAAGRKKR